MCGSIWSSIFGGAAGTPGAPDAPVQPTPVTPPSLATAGSKAARTAKIGEAQASGINSTIKTSSTGLGTNIGTSKQVDNNLISPLGQEAQLQQKKLLGQS